MEMSALEDRLQCKELWMEALKAQKTLKGRFVRQLATTEEESTALKSQMDQLNAAADLEKGSMQVKDKHLRQAISILTGERIGILSRDELAKLREAKTVLSQYIVGQPEALERIGGALREIAVRQKTGAVKNRPIVSMLLPGPTGVGKTEVAKAIAKEFMNNNMIRLDMSDFMEKHDISRLTGAPPGYVGYDNGGLVDQVRKNPQSVIVFDEIEKAHPDIFNVLLQILEEGELRDNQSQPVNFRNAIVVLTSNLNNEEITQALQQHQQQMARGGRGVDKQLAAKALETQVKQLLTADSSSERKGFRPEHLGRLDYVIPFAPLTIGSVSDILDIRLREMNQEPCLKDNNLTVQLSDGARNRLIELTAASSLLSTGEPVSREGLQNMPLQSGARDVRSNFEQLISRKVFDALTFELDELENANLVVDYDPDRQDFTVKPAPLEDLDL